ncbi:MAG: OmpA family protein, partial [Ghiorsea sp.]|nr:OmpA family protein [Ghiorsea sp.]
DTPVRGVLYPSNWELSAARAMSLFHAFSERGVPNGRMIAAGMGDKHPIQGDPKMSRRVEIELKFKPVKVNPESQVQSGKLILPQRHVVAPQGKSF